MNISKTGFILYTIKYQKCIEFYSHILELEILYQKESLTCYDFYGSYLMVEIDNETDLQEASIPDRDRTCIRINVPDVKEACKVLDKNNITYSYREADWGTIAKFRDPDGNLIGFRSAKEHQSDIQENLAGKE